jgi:hypothetical protein
MPVMVTGAIDLPPRGDNGSTNRPGAAWIITCAASFIRGAMSK